MHIYKERDMEEKRRGGGVNADRQNLRNGKNEEGGGGEGKRIKSEVV